MICLNRAQIDIDYPHQIALAARECVGDKGKLHRLFCANLNISSGPNFAIINDITRFIYCFVNRIDAMQFRKEFGGRQLPPTIVEPLQLTA